MPSRCSRRSSASSTRWSRCPCRWPCRRATRDGKWQNFAAAWFDALKDRAQDKEPNPATVAITQLYAAYDRQDAAAFNRHLAEYEALLASNPPADYDAAKVDYEQYFNFFEPFYVALVLYVAAFVLAAVGWLGWTGPLNKAAFRLIVLALAIHTFALISRIYISGRPPVTNLYSTAVFIGWGGVVLGLVMEMIYKLGIGNVIASVAGFVTLLDRQLPGRTERRRHDGRVAGRARHPVLAGHARRVHHPRLRHHVHRRSAGHPVHPARRVHAQPDRPRWASSSAA